MRTTFKALAAFCSFALAFNTGCTKTTAPEAQTGTALFGNTADNDSSVVPEQVNECDTTPVTQATCTAAFTAEGVNVSGRGASASGKMLTITAAGVYELTGECAEAAVIIDAGKDDEVSLLLNGAKLSCKSGSVINCQQAGKLVITSAEGSENTISDSAEYPTTDEESATDAAIFSKSDIVINGTGELSVNGNYSAGIHSKDGIKICGTQLTVNAADDAVKGKDYVVISGGSINIECSGNGIKSTNAEDASLGYVSIKGGDISITSDEDAVQAETELLIDNGNISIATGGGSSTVEYKIEEFGWGSRNNSFDLDSADSSASSKALKAGKVINISGGDFDIDSADDALHSNGNIVISGGSFAIATGDDALHADENVTINDGKISITASYEGIEGNSIDINGGTIDLYSFDDGFNAGGGDSGTPFGSSTDGEERYICISGGNITINADGDGIDSNGSVAMSGGIVVVFGPTNSGNGALDYDSSFAVSGGTLIALGSAGMAQAPSTLSQPCIAVNSDVSAGSTIEVRGEDDTVILSVETPKKAQSLIFSSDKLVSGKTYSVCAGGSVLESVTVSDGVTGSGANSGMGFGGGMHGGGGRGGWENMGTPSQLPDDFTPPEGFDPANKPEGFDKGNRGDKPGRMPEQPAETESSATA